MKDLEISLKPIKDFFNIKRLEGLVLSILVQNTLTDELNSIKNLTNHFGYDTLIIPQINETIEELFKKNLIYIVNQKKYRRGELKILKTINVNNKVIEAIMTGDISQLQLK